MVDLVCLVVFAVWRLVASVCFCTVVGMVPGTEVGLTVGITVQAFTFGGFLLINGGIVPAGMVFAA